MTASSLSCPRCGLDDMLIPELRDASMCTSCALKQWPQLEAPFAARQYCGAGGPGAVRHVPGNPAVLLSAPCSVNFWRGDSRQKAARYTGSGIEALAHATGLASVAAAGQPRQLPFTGSPEYAYADTLRHRVGPEGFVLDVLGMRDRSVDVCVGLGPVPDMRTERVADVIRSRFAARGVRVAVNEPFAALSPWSVTAFVQTQLGASAVQVQLAAWLRDPVGQPMMAKLTLDVLRAAAAHAVP